MPCHLNTFDDTANQKDEKNQKYENITTLADVFVKAGYQAVWFGKTHWGQPRFMDGGAGGKNKQAAKQEEEESFGRLPQQSQIANWPIEKNAEHQTADKAINFLSSNKDKKFFLGVSFLKPHFPFAIQQKYYDMYKDQVPEPRASEELIHDLPAVSQMEREKYGFAKATTTDISRTRALYYGMVTYVDEEFGRILRKLDELGLREKTIIIYTADHGEMLGDRGIWYKNSFYDESAGIPFIWSFPKELPQGKVSNAPVMNMDIFPTLCDLCHLPAPEGLEGSSLVPVMKDMDAVKDRYALSENYRDGFEGRMIRTETWKYFFYTDGEEYLYDMLHDPGEEHNLAKNPDYREFAATLKKKASLGWVQEKDKSSKNVKKKAKHPRRSAFSFSPRPSQRKEFRAAPVADRYAASRKSV
jgi:arylsulfatase A-like enzyme